MVGIEAWINQPAEFALMSPTSPLITWRDSHSFSDIGKMQLFVHERKIACHLQTSPCVPAALYLLLTSAHTISYYQGWWTPHLPSGKLYLMLGIPLNSEYTSHLSLNATECILMWVFPTINFWGKIWGGEKSWHSAYVTRIVSRNAKWKLLVASSIKQTQMQDS